MNSHADKTQEDKNQSVANAAVQKQRDGELFFQFADNRPEAIQMRNLHELANSSLQVKQLRGFQEMADNSPQVIQAAQLQAMADSHIHKALSRSVSFDPVTQLVRMVLIKSYSGQEIDIDDQGELDDLIEMIEDEDEGPAIKKEIATMPAVLHAIEQRKPGLLSSIQPKEDPVAKEKAEKDTGGWFVPAAGSREEKMIFLNDVLRVARSIIPAAFNRSIEVGTGKTDYINTAYACKDALVHAYATDLQKAGITIKNNYIHPAALERMYQIIQQTAPDLEAQEASLSGVCKDFASICYGLILQNDVSGTYKPKLALMHGHVYVEVDIEGEPFAVDAWLGGEVMPKAKHEINVSKTHKGIIAADRRDLFEGSGYQESLDASYEKAELARLIWYQNEGTYREIASKEWSRGKTTHVNRGSL